MPELFVVCWGFNNRLDERGGWGFSIHPNQKDADLWIQDANIHREVIGADMNAISIPYVCGKGVIKNPSDQLVTQLGNKPGIFVQKLDESELSLFFGNTPDEVTMNFMDEMNSGPD